MIARVDGLAVSSDPLWWPAMNFGQFRCDHPLGEYELEFPRAEFVRHMEPSYEQCVAELRVDDALVPGQSSPLEDAGYPSLHDLPDHPAAFFEAVSVYLWDALFGEFLPWPPSATARFIVNSIEAVSTSSAVVCVRGRGYHAVLGRTQPVEPGAAAEGASTA
jgi:hypothetical protein